MQRLRGSYWRIRITLSARWWMLKFDLRSAWRLLRYAILAACGRVVILDEQAMESRGGYRYVQLAITQLPVAEAQETRQLR
jgi:hypothetical protein